MTNNSEGVAGAGLTHIKGADGSPQTRRLRTSERDGDGRVNALEKDGWCVCVVVNVRRADSRLHLMGSGWCGVPYRCFVSFVVTF